MNQFVTGIFIIVIIILLSIFDVWAYQTGKAWTLSFLLRNLDGVWPLFSYILAFGIGAIFSYIFLGG